METSKELLNILDWTSVKARIIMSEHRPFPRKREVWWASLGQNIGIEVNGKNKRFERPVLVISVLNADSLFVAPITSTIGGNQRYLIPFTSHNGTSQSVNIFQLRTLSTKRFIRKISDISIGNFNAVLDSINKQVLIKTEASAN